MNKNFNSFDEFYPFYLSQHSNTTCRLLHFIGTSFVLVILLHAILAMTTQFLVFIPFAGYGCAWIGHFYFENNKPATFSYPVYSLMGDFRMYSEIIQGKIKVI